MEGTAQHGVELSERLIRAVARAFYSDNVVVVLDALVSEKYIPENELPVRLQLREKEISRVISQLQRERMIHSEETDGAKCIYIDYRAFVNVVRYRLHVAQKVLQGNEERNVRFQCPSCSSTFSALEVQNMKSKDYKFICSHCCPTLGELRAVKSEPHFTLVGVALESDQRSSVKKLNKQLSAPGPCEPSRDGIFELLRELRTCPLVHNKPSVTPYPDPFLNYYAIFTFF
jgi:transcription initiation factor IIE alpha subunit